MQDVRITSPHMTMTMTISQCINSLGKDFLTICFGTGGLRERAASSRYSSNHSAACQERLIQMRISGVPIVIILHFLKTHQESLLHAGASHWTNMRTELLTCCSKISDLEKVVAFVIAYVILFLAIAALMKLVHNGATHDRGD